VGNITQEDFKAAKEQYALVSTDYEKNKITVTKSGIFKICYAYWTATLRPQAASLASVILHMLRSGEYVPSSQWLLSPNGRGMDKDRAEAMWMAIHEPSTLTKVCGPSFLPRKDLLLYYFHPNKITFLCFS
jgi:hypothetical protein